MSPCSFVSDPVGLLDGTGEVPLGDFNISTEQIWQKKANLEPILLTMRKLMQTGGVSEETIIREYIITNEMREIRLTDRRNFFWMNFTGII